MPEVRPAPSKPEPIAYISYKADTDKVKKRVFDLATRLREDGIDCKVEEYDSFAPEDWLVRLKQQIQEVNFALIVCTQGYSKLLKDNPPALETLTNAENVIIVLLDAADKQWVPSPLDSNGHYQCDMSARGAYEGLRRLLNRIPDKETELTNSEEKAAPRLGLDDLKQSDFTGYAWSVLQAAMRLGDGRPSPEVASVSRLVAALMLSGLEDKDGSYTGGWLLREMRFGKAKEKRLIERYPVIEGERPAFTRLLSRRTGAATSMTSHLRRTLDLARLLATEGGGKTRKLQISARHLLGAAICRAEEDRIRKFLQTFGMPVEELRSRLLEQLPGWGVDDEIGVWRQLIDNADSQPVDEKTVSHSAEPASEPTRTPDTWMLSDRPLKEDFQNQDQFRFMDYAVAIAAVLDDDKTGTPFTMAINAPWGAGKTTLANMIAKELEERRQPYGKPSHVICWFNAWMHDDAANLATAFISAVSRSANRHRHWLVRLFNPLPAAMLEPTRRRRRRLAATGVLLSMTLIASLWIGEHLPHVNEYKEYETGLKQSYQTTDTLIRDGAGRGASSSQAVTVTQSRATQPSPQEPARDGTDRFLAWLQNWAVVLGAFFTALAGVVGILAKVLSSTSLGGYVQAPDKAAEAGTIDPAVGQLKKLIQQATRGTKRFVVFVDDIERCKPPRSVDVLDAVSQLMDHEGVVVILLGDMAAVAAAAQLKYKELAEIYVPSGGVLQTGRNPGKEAFGRFYLQKIVQFQFDLPIPPKSKIQEYMGRLAVTPAASGDTRDSVSK